MFQDKGMLNSEEIKAVAIAIHFLKASISSSKSVTQPAENPVKQETFRILYQLHEWIDG